MRHLDKKIRQILMDTRGESLIEGLASILVFTVLVATVTMMIMISLRMTTISTFDAENRQIEAGAVLTGAATVFDDEDEVEIGSNPGLIQFEVRGDTEVPVPVNVIIFNSDSDNNYTAFEPTVPAGP